MSDAELRELERRWKESGSPADEQAYRRALGHTDHWPVRYVVKTLRVAVPIHNCHRCGLEAPAELGSLEDIGRNIRPRGTVEANQLIPDNVHGVVDSWKGVPEGWVRLERMTHGPAGKGWYGVPGKHTAKLCATCAEEVNQVLDEVLSSLKPKAPS